MDQHCRRTIQERNIDDSRRLHQVKRKKQEPKWYEVEKPMRKPALRAPQPSIWVPTPSPLKVPEDNVWSRRQEVSELRQEAISDLLPQSPEDEAEMLRRALQLSQQTAREEAERQKLRKLKNIAAENTVPQPYRPAGYQTQRTKEPQCDSIWDMQPNKPSFQQSDARMQLGHQDASYARVSRPQTNMQKGGQHDTQMHLEHAEYEAKIDQFHSEKSSNRALCDFDYSKLKTESSSCDKRTAYEETAFSISGNSSSSEVWDNEIEDVFLKKSVLKEIGRDGQVHKVIQVKTSLQERPEPVATPVISVDRDACVKRHQADNQNNNHEKSAAISPPGIGRGMDWKTKHKDLHLTTVNQSQPSSLASDRTSSGNNTRPLPQRTGFGNRHGPQSHGGVPVNNKSSAVPINCEFPRSKTGRGGFGIVPTSVPSQRTDIVIPDLTSKNDKLHGHSPTQDETPQHSSTNVRLLPSQLFTSQVENVNKNLPFTSQVKNVNKNLPFTSQVENVNKNVSFTSQVENVNKNLPFTSQVENVNENLPFTSQVENVNKNLPFTSQVENVNKNLPFTSQVENVNKNLPFKTREVRAHNIGENWEEEIEDVPKMKSVNIDNMQKPYVRPSGLSSDQSQISGSISYNNNASKQHDRVNLPACTHDNLKFNQVQSDQSEMRKDLNETYQSSSSRSSNREQQGDSTDESRRLQVLKDLASTQAGVPRLPKISMKPEKFVPSDESEVSDRRDVSHVTVIHVKPGEGGRASATTQPATMPVGNQPVTTPVGNLTNTQPVGNQSDINQRASSSVPVSSIDTNHRASPVNNSPSMVDPGNGLPVGLPPHLVQAYLQYIAQTAAENVNPGLMGSGIRPGFFAGSLPMLGMPNPFMAPFGAPFCSPMLPFGVNPIMPGMGNPLVTLALQQQMKKQMAATQLIPNPSPQRTSHTAVPLQPTAVDTAGALLQTARNTPVPLQQTDSCTPTSLQQTDSIPPVLPQQTSSASQPHQPMSFRPDQSQYPVSDHSKYVNHVNQLPNNKQDATRNTQMPVPSTASTSTKPPLQASNVSLPEPTMKSVVDESLMDYTQMNASIADICQKVTLTNKSESLNVSKVNDTLLDYSVMNASVADMMKKITLSNKPSGNNSMADFSFMNQSLNDTRQTSGTSQAQDSLLDYTQMNASVADACHKLPVTDKAIINNSLDTSYMNASIKEPGQRVCQRSDFDEGTAELRIPKQPAMTTILPLKRSTVVAEDPAVVSAELTPNLSANSLTSNVSQPLLMADPSVIKISPKFERITPVSGISKSASSLHPIQNAVPGSVCDYFPPEPAESDLDESRGEGQGKVTSWPSQHLGAPHAHPHTAARDRNSHGDGKHTFVNRPFTNEFKETSNRLLAAPSTQSRGGFGSTQSNQFPISTEAGRPKLGFSSRSQYQRFSTGPGGYSSPNLPPRLQAQREKTQAVKEMIKTMRQEDLEQDKIPVDAEKCERSY